MGPLTFRELAASFQQAGASFPALTPPVIPAQNFAPGGDWGDFLQQAGFTDIAWHGRTLAGGICGSLGLS